MFKVKYVPFVFPFFDRLGIEQWLEKQAASGWILEQAGSPFWKFSRSGPKALHYSVVYQPKLEPDDPAWDVRAQQFAQYCAHAGWHPVTETARMQIYCNEAIDPTPIETDSWMELENIHSTAKKSYLRHSYLCVLSSVLLLLNFILRIGNLASFVFAGNGAVVYAVALVLLLILTSMNVAGYYLWYRRARRAAQMGGSLPAVKRRVQRVLLMALVLCFAAYLLTMGWQAALTILALVLAVALGMVLITLNSKRMRQQKYPVFENRVYTGILSALLIFTVTVTGMLTGFLVEEKPPKESTPPVHIQELIGQITDCECSAMVTDSIFIRRTRVDCPNEEMGYQVVEVKLPFVYDAAVRFYLDMYKDPIYMRFMGEGFDPNFREISAQPWGAGQAYCLIWEPKNLYQYVICYEGRVIYVGNDKPLTEEQMALIGEKLGA